MHVDPIRGPLLAYLAHQSLGVTAINVTRYLEARGIIDRHDHEVHLVVRSWLFDHPQFVWVDREDSWHLRDEIKKAILARSAEVEEACASQL